MTRRKTRIHIRDLSNFTTDPPRAGEAMLEAAKLTVRSTKIMLAVHFQKRIKVRRIGTMAVEKSAQFVTESVVRSEKTVVKMMDMRHCKHLQQSQSHSVELIFAPWLEKIAGLTFVSNRRLSLKKKCGL